MSIETRLLPRGSLYLGCRNDKAEELRDLEAQLDESRQNEQAYAHRVRRLRPARSSQSLIHIGCHKIAELEEAVEELDRLRDEVEM